MTIKHCATCSCSQPETPAEPCEAQTMELAALRQAVRQINRWVELCDAGELSAAGALTQISFDARQVKSAGES